jgi:hypothetical protein
MSTPEDGAAHKPSDTASLPHEFGAMPRHRIPPLMTTAHQRGPRPSRVSAVVFFLPVARCSHRAQCVRAERRGSHL